MASARQIGLTSAVALVVANMIGTGVFTTTGFLLSDLRSPVLVLLAWAAGGVIALLGALSYGALAQAIPESGGEYTYLSRTLHPAAGFLAGWVSLLAGFSAPLAAVAFGFGEYCTFWLPPGSVRWTGSLLLILCVGLHGLHVQRGARLQNLAVGLKLVLLAAFIGLGFSRLSGQTSGSVPGWATDPGGFPLGAFAVSLVWVSFSYAGWNAATYIGGEVRDPERNLPRSLLYGTVLVTVVYLGINGVFLAAAPLSEMAGQLQVGRIAARNLGGGGWEGAMTILVALALATSASAMMMAGPRVYARMASEGCLPKWFAPPPDTQRPPGKSILLQLVLALLFLWTGSYTGLLTYIGFTLGLSNAAVVVGLIRLHRQGRMVGTLPGGLTLPLLFLIFTLYAVGFTLWRQPRECVIGAATLLLGVVAWRLGGKRNVDAGGEMEEGKAPEN